MNQRKKATVTQADLDAAGRLRRIWDQNAARQRQEGRQPFTQESVGAALGMTQGAVSQYLNGKIPLGYGAVLGFARILGVKPSEIRNDLELIQVDDEERFVHDYEYRVLRAHEMSQPAGPSLEMIAAAAELTRNLIEIRQWNPDFREHVPLLALALQVVMEDQGAGKPSSILDLTKRLAARFREETNDGDR